MLRAGGVMVLTRYLLLLFLLALQAQNVHSAPLHGQGAGKDSQKIPVVPKGLLRALVKTASETDHEIVQKKIFPMGEGDSMPGSDGKQEAMQDTRSLAQPKGHSGRSAAGQKAKTAGQWKLSKNYILVSIAVSAVLLLAAVVGYIVMYRLLKRDTTSQGDKEVSAESSPYPFLDSKD